MKLPSLFVLLVGCLAAYAETEEQINKRFAVQPGGTLVVDVDFGSIDVATNASKEVIVDVFRKVRMPDKSDEEAFLRDRPVTFSQEGNTVTIRSRRQNKTRESWRGAPRTPGGENITPPPPVNT